VELSTGALLLLLFLLLRRNPYINRIHSKGGCVKSVMNVCCCFCCCAPLYQPYAQHSRVARTRQKFVIANRAAAAAAATAACVIQLVAFLEKLGELRSLTPLAASMARQLDKAYSLDAAKNCEIRCAWYKVGALLQLAGQQASQRMCRCSTRHVPVCRQ
jgi:hypothetical protein